MKLAAALAIVHLFSIPAVHRHMPKDPPLPNRARFYCQYTSGKAYELCCVWNQRELSGFGAWDCQVWPTDGNLRPARLTYVPRSV
jgi:hypothetical protein